MSQGQGTISSNDLMMKLVQAKKVMNKVNTTSTFNFLVKSMGKYLV